MAVVMKTIPEALLQVGILAVAVASVEQLAASAVAQVVGVAAVAQKVTSN